MHFLSIIIDLIHMVSSSETLFGAIKQKQHVIRNVLFYKSQFDQLQWTLVWTRYFSLKVHFNSVVMMIWFEISARIGIKHKMVNIWNEYTRRRVDAVDEWMRSYQFAMQRYINEPIMIRGRPLKFSGVEYVWNCAATVKSSTSFSWKLHNFCFWMDFLEIIMCTFVLTSSLQKNCERW